MPPLILIVDANPWTRDLLKSLVLAVRADALVHEYGHGYQALAELDRHKRCTLIIVERPADCDGLDLLRRIRQRGAQPLQPVILLSDQADTAYVRAALRLAPTAYLVKPYAAEEVLRRLRSLMPPADDEAQAARAAVLGSLDDHLQRMAAEIDAVPLFTDLPAIIQRCRDSASCSLGELETEFGQDPLVTATLIAAANSASQRVGQSCQTLSQALPRLGVGFTLNLVLGLSLRRATRLTDPLLATRAEGYLHLAQRAADCARLLALRYAREDAERCYTAGLLHRLGELAVLQGVQRWCDGGGVLEEAALERALLSYSLEFSAELQRHWRLPLELRELVTAVHSLHGVLPKPSLILHLAAQAANPAPGESLEALLEHKAGRMLGLEAAVWQLAVTQLKLG
ncbi:response regulator [Pseudomonas oryzihabitans]|uniref:response regulator n=1 Tax=Pseudomonas oryzihabitans TaxID=47885 RepID=UPI00214F443D|nr:response regulator [Pseudomonas psychrotolerans]UUW71609.1 response regulator [Pseudomonas psychrotolerans]